VVIKNDSIDKSLNSLYPSQKARMMEAAHVYRKVPHGWLGSSAGSSVFVKDFRNAMHALGMKTEGGMKGARTIASKVLDCNPRRIGEMMAKADDDVLSFHHEETRALCEALGISIPLLFRISVAIREKSESVELR
jgi:hypothetical protein